MSRDAEKHPFGSPSRLTREEAIDCAQAWLADRDHAVGEFCYANEVMMLMDESAGFQLETLKPSRNRKRDLADFRFRRGWNVVFEATSPPRPDGKKDIVMVIVEESGEIWIMGAPPEGRHD